VSEAEKELIRATVRGFSRAIILWLVSQKPMSGYRVVKEINRLTGQELHSGIVYPLLYELEKEGLITGEWMQKGRRRIKCYLATEKGTKLLNRLRELFEMPVKEVLRDLIRENGTK
jgi:DNA-binding PadR family transcriptional regulator